MSLALFGQLGLVLLIWAVVALIGAVVLTILLGLYTAFKNGGRP